MSDVSAPKNPNGTTPGMFTITGLPADPPVGSVTDMKSRIFSAKNKVRRSQVVEFFGEQIEIRQPSLTQMLENDAADLEDKKFRNAFVLINYAYKPGTDEKVFDVADIDSINDLPYGKDFERVMEAYQLVTGTVKVEEKN